MFDKVGAVLGVAAIAMSVGVWVQSKNSDVQTLLNQIESLGKEVSTLQAELISIQGELSSAKTELSTKIDQAIATVTISVNVNAADIDRLESIPHYRWENITSNPDPFDTACSYKWQLNSTSNAGAYIHATYIKREYIQADYSTDVQLSVDFRDKSKANGSFTNVAVSTWRLCVDSN